MLMKLKSYSDALQIFERALKINPLLVNTSLSENIETCKRYISNMTRQSSIALYSYDESNIIENKNSNEQEYKSGCGTTTSSSEYSSSSMNTKH